MEKTNALLDVMGLKGNYKVVAGAESGMTSADKPVDSEGARLLLISVHLRHCIRKRLFWDAGTVSHF